MYSKPTFTKQGRFQVHSDVASNPHLQTWGSCSRLLSLFLIEHDRSLKTKWHESISYSNWPHLCNSMWVILVRLLQFERELWGFPGSFKHIHLQTFKSMLWFLSRPHQTGKYSETRWYFISYNVYVTAYSSFSFDDSNLRLKNESFQVHSSIHWILIRRFDEWPRPQIFGELPPDKLHGQARIISCYKVSKRTKLLSLDQTKRNYISYTEQHTIPSLSITPKKNEDYRLQVDSLASKGQCSLEGTSTVEAYNPKSKLLRLLLEMKTSDLWMKVFN